MRVVFLTHYFPPELGAAPARIDALARGLAERGIEVTVHTGHPHYPSGVIAPGYANRLLRRTRRGPVRLLRSVVYPTANRGFARRLLNHAVFAAGAAAMAPACGPVDVVVAETPPLFTAAAGVAYARCKRAALVLNVSDLWPQSAIELGAVEHPGAIRAAHALAERCYAAATLIATPTTGIVRALSAIGPAAGKARLVPPAVDCARFASLTPAAPSPAAPLRVLYAGTLGLAQGFGVLLDAAARAGASVVELRIAGEGPELEGLWRAVADRGVANVRLLGPVAPERVPELYGDVHAGLVPLRDLPIFRGALPTKLFEILAAGRPAIVAARGESADLVEGAGAGIVVAPDDPLALADAFRRLRADPGAALAMGRRGREVARAHDRGAAIDTWARLLDEAATGRSGRAAPDRSPADSARARAGSRSWRRPGHRPGRTSPR